MTPVRRIVCPSCESGLKVAATLPPEKRIRCPKCDATFRFAEARDWARGAVKAATVPALAKGPVLSDEEDIEQVKRRPAARKAVKKKLALGSPLVLGLGAAAAVLVIGGGVTLALVRPWETKKSTSVAKTTPANAEPRPSRPRKMPGGAPGPKEGGKDPDAAGQKVPDGPENAAPSESLAAPAGKEPTGAVPMQLAAGKSVYDALDCTRCHSVGTSAAGGFKKGPRGPNLARVGANPAHTADWLSEQIRNPRSHRPNSRMPAYPEDKISSDDLRSLAEYLASLK